MSSTLAIACALAGLLLLVACGDRSERREPTPAAPAIAPMRLADTGLYQDFATRSLHPDVLPFSPQYPLWTDGAIKQRWIRVPPDTTIDAADPDRWVFPIGTRIWKEFAFDRRVETRFMELGADGAWLYASYAWNADGTDAVLAPPRGIRAAWRSADGAPHDIPGVADCRACHAGADSPVLGFSALQLSPDRDPGAPHAQAPAAGSVDLAVLWQRGLLRNLPRQLLAQPPRIAARSPRERAALGYLHANCGSCHAAGGPLTDSLGLTLAWPLDRRNGTPPAIATTVGQPSRYQPRDADPAQPWPRIAAGDPERSVLLARISCREPAQQMPPIGTHQIDPEGVALLTAWIRADLPAGDPSPPSVTARK